MADDAEYMFRKTAGVVLNLDHNEFDKIRFMLPNGHLYKYKLVNIIQQIQINEKIRSYTNGKKWIEWSMLGMNNVKDVIQRFEKYRDEFKNTFFNKMKLGTHIKDIQILGNEIIFNLDGNRMKQLNSKWEYKIANELMQYCVLHTFEIVIVTKKTTKQNNNKTTTDREYKNKNENTYKNMQIQRLDYVLDKWDTEMDVIHKEFDKRQQKICNVMNEEFRLLTDIVDRFKNKLYLFNEMKQRLDMELFLKLNERNSKRGKTFMSDLKTLENKLESEKVNLLEQEIKMKEGGVNEHNLDTQEMDLKTRIKNEKDRANKMDKLIKTCENILLIISDYDQEEKIIQLDHLRDEWLKLNEFLESYDGNLFIDVNESERSLNSLIKGTSGLTLQQQKMKMKNVANDNTLINTPTFGIVGRLIVGKDIGKINLKIVVSGSATDGNLLNFGLSIRHNNKSIIISTLSMVGSLIFDIAARKININLKLVVSGDNSGSVKICEIDGTLLNHALMSHFYQMDLNVQGYYSDYG